MLTSNSGIWIGFSKEKFNGEGIHHLPMKISLQKISGCQMHI